MQAPSGIDPGPLGIDLGNTAPAGIPSDHPPVLLVVIDTEEEFDWTRPFDRAQRSVAAIADTALIQPIFESIGVRPTYVIDHPVADDPASASVMADYAARGVAEIGAHLHPWVTPPGLEEVSARNSYAGNLDPALELSKLRSLVATIQERVAVQPLTFKAGRYGLAWHSLDALRDCGFKVDLSSSPGFDWSGDGGPVYRHYPNRMYWLPGKPRILEIPTTGGFYGPLRMLGPFVAPVDNHATSRESRVSRLLRRTGLARRAMLTPEGFSVAQLQALATRLLADGERVLTLSFHSPSLRPGCTPFVRSIAERDAFIARIRDFIVWFRQRTGAVGLTAAEVLKLAR